MRVVTRIFLELLPILFCWFIALRIGAAYAQNASPLASWVSPTPTVEYALPYPGILPDHPLYWVKRMRDGILVFFTRGPSKQAELFLLFSNKKLVMGRLLWEKRLPETSLATFKEGESDLLHASELLLRAKSENTLPVSIRETFESAAKKHVEVLQAQQGAAENETEKASLAEVLEITRKAIENVNTLE